MTSRLASVNPNPIRPLVIALAALLAVGGRSPPCSGRKYAERDTGRAGRHSDRAGREVTGLGSLLDVQASVLEIDITGTAPDSARVRVIHESPDAGSVDVAVTVGDEDVAAATPTAAGRPVVPVVLVATNQVRGTASW